MVSQRPWSCNQFSWASQPVSTDFRETAKNPPLSSANSTDHKCTLTMYSGDLNKPWWHLERIHTAWHLNQLGARSAQCGAWAGGSFSFPCASAPFLLPFCSRIIRMKKVMYQRSNYHASGTLLSQWAGGWTSCMLHTLQRHCTPRLQSPNISKRTVRWFLWVLTTEQLTHIPVCLGPQISNLCLPLNRLCQCAH